MGRKKKVLVGAPPYMAQYTALMIILLAFFILLNTLAPKQESGFKDGIGDVKNAFGIKGGFGLNRFSFFGKGGGKAPIPKNKEDKDGKTGMDEDLVKGSGGSGNTETKPDNKKQKRFFKITIPYEFEKQKISLPKKLDEYLSKIGIVFALKQYDITVKYFSNDTTDNSINQLFSLKRVAQIIKKLKSTGVDASRISCDIYDKNSVHFLTSGIKNAKNKEEKQQGYFYIYVN